MYWEFSGFSDFYFVTFGKFDFFFSTSFLLSPDFLGKIFFFRFLKKKNLLIFQFIQISRRPKNSLIFIQHRKSYAHPKRNADEKLMMFRIWN